MKFEVNVKDLRTGLNRIRGIVPAHTTIESLYSVKMAAKGKRLVLTASNFVVTASVAVPAYATEAGVTLLPANLLASFIGKIREPQISFDVDADNRARLRYGEKNCIQISGMGSDSFPNHPGFNDPVMIRIPADRFLSLLHTIIYAVSDENKTPDGRAALTGVSMKFHQNHVEAAAIDGYRGSVAHADCRIKDDKAIDIVVAQKAAKTLLNFLENNDDEIVIRASKQFFCVKQGDALLTARNLDQPFVDYGKIVAPTQPSQATVRCSKSDLVEALERADLIAKQQKNNVIRIEANDGKLSIFSSIKNEDGEDAAGSESIEARCSGVPQRLFLNAEFLKDAVKSQDSDELSLEMSGREGVIYVNSETGRGFLLPVRVAD